MTGPNVDDLTASLQAIKTEITLPPSVSRENVGIALLPIKKPEPSALDILEGHLQVLIRLMSASADTVRFVLPLAIVMSCAAEPGRAMRDVVEDLGVTIPEAKPTIVALIEAGLLETDGKPRGDRTMIGASADFTLAYVTAAKPEADIATMPAEGVA